MKERVEIKSSFKKYLPFILVPIIVIIVLFFQFLLFMGVPHGMPIIEDIAIPIHQIISYEELSVQKIQGTIVDSVSKAPLEGIKIERKIFYADKDGWYTYAWRENISDYTSTDSNGNFHFESKVLDKKGNNIQEYLIFNSDYESFNPSGGNLVYDFYASENPDYYPFQMEIRNTISKYYTYKSSFEEGHRSINFDMNNMQNEIYHIYLAPVVELEKDCLSNKDCLHYHNMLIKSRADSLRVDERRYVKKTPKLNVLKIEGSANYSNNELILTENKSALTLNGGAFFDFSLEFEGNPSYLALEYELKEEGDGDELGIWYNQEKQVITSSFNARNIYIPTPKSGEEITIALHGTGKENAIILIKGIYLLYKNK